MSFITNLTSATPSTGTYNNDGFPSGVDNDLGVIPQIGTNGDQGKFKNKPIATAHNNIDVTSVSGANGVDGIIGGHPFNGGTEIQMRASSTVGGSAVNSILFGGSNSASVSRSINQHVQISTTYYKTAIRNNKWNEATGAWDSGFPQVANSGGWSIEDGNDEAAVLEQSGTDHTANPSASVPGELVYMQGNPVPNQDEYDSRTLS